MGLIPPGDWSLRVAPGGFTDPRRVGWCDGGYLRFDKDLRRWKGWEDKSGTAGGVQDGGTAGGVQAPALQGISWVEEIGAAILAWETVPLDIVESEWKTGGGKFAVVRPPGDPSTTRLHQFDSTPELEWFAVREGMPADRAFCVSLYREATPARAEIVNEDLLPYYYTEIRFGGQFSLRLPKWRNAELWKLGGSGAWELAIKMPWRHSELYNDSHSQQEMFVTFMPVDGLLLLIASNYTDEAVVYQEETAVRLGRAAVEVRGNGGAGYVGLHDVVFSTGEENYLEEIGGTQDPYGSRSLTAPTKARRFWLREWPEGVVLGSKPAGCKAEIELVDEDGAPWTRARWEAMYETYEDNHPGEAMETKLIKRLRLSTTDEHVTPIVRWCGLVGKARLEAKEALWEDLSERVLSIEGTWQVDLKKRIGWQEYTVELDNTDGHLQTWVGNRRCELGVGYAARWKQNPDRSWVPDLDFPWVQRRALSYLQVTDDDVTDVATATIKARTLDRLMSLFEIECGHRQPLDGMLVTEALQTAATWGGMYASFGRLMYPGHGGGLHQSEPDEFGVWYQSGRKLPRSRFEAAHMLMELGLAVEGAGGDEDRAVCQPKPDQSVGDFMLQLMQFEPYTFLYYSVEGKLEYFSVLDVTVGHWMRETETAGPTGVSGLQAIRGGLTHRLGEGEKKTSVLVTGREKATGEPLRAYLADVEAMTDGKARGFVGYERLERIADDNLNTQGAVNLRCIWEYEAQRAYADRVSFGCLGQPNMHPLEKLVVVESRSRGGGRTYVITAVKDSVGKDKAYTGQIDAVDLDALRGLVGRATGEG